MRNHRGCASAVVLGCWLVGWTTAASSQTLQQVATIRSANFRPTVEVFADGNVKSAISQSDKATTASGALGMRYVGARFLASGVINLVGVSDTVTSGWGATLLAPAAGKTLNAGLLDIRYRRRDARDSTCLRRDPSLFCNQ